MIYLVFYYTAMHSQPLKQWTLWLLTKLQKQLITSTPYKLMWQTVGLIKWGKVWTAKKELFNWKIISFQEQILTYSVNHWYLIACNIWKDYYIFNPHTAKWYPNFRWDEIMINIDIKQSIKVSSFEEAKNISYQNFIPSETLLWLE